MNSYLMPYFVGLCQRFKFFSGKWDLCECNVGPCNKDASEDYGFQAVRESCRAVRDNSPKSLKGFAGHNAVRKGHGHDSSI